MPEPLFDLVDKGPYFLLEVALPGILETDIDITLEGSRLVIRAERPEVSEPILHHEIERGLLVRNVELPQAVEIVHSSFEDGVLRLELKRLEGL